MAHRLRQPSMALNRSLTRTAKNVTVSATKDIKPMPPNTSEMSDQNLDDLCPARTKLPPQQVRVRSKKQAKAMESWNRGSLGGPCAL